MSGTLAVYIFEENHVVQEKIWSVLDSPKGVWTQAEISFKKPMPCKVRLFKFSEFWEIFLAFSEFFVMGLILSELYLQSELAGDFTEEL